MSNLQISEISAYSKFKTFLMEYHKTITKEFEIQHLGINKCLIAASKIFGFETHHEMIHNLEKLESENKVLTVKKEIITVIVNERLNAEGDFDTKIKTFTDEIKSRTYMRELFDEQFRDSIFSREDMLDSFPDIEGEDLETLHQIEDDNEFAQWISDNHDGLELITELDSLTFQYLSVKVVNSWETIEIALSDIA